MVRPNSLGAGWLSSAQTRATPVTERLEGRTLLSWLSPAEAAALPLVVNGDDSDNQIVVAQSAADPNRGVVIVDGVIAAEFVAATPLQINGLGGADTLAVEAPRQILASEGPDQIAINFAGGQGMDLVAARVTDSTQIRPSSQVPALAMIWRLLETDAERMRLSGQTGAQQANLVVRRIEQTPLQQIEFDRGGAARAIVDVEASAADETIVASRTSAFDFDVSGLPFALSCRNILGAANSVLIVSGGRGNDFVDAADLESTLITATFGSDGNDVLVGGAGSDDIHGGAGDDYIIGARVYGDDGNDTLVVAEGGDFAYGNAGNDLIIGSAQGNLLNGGTGNDTIAGGDGHDTLHWRCGQRSASRPRRPARCG